MNADAALLDRIRRLACWSGAVSIEPLSGGLSNRSFTVRDSAGAFVARVVGGDVPAHGILREREVAASRAAFAAGVAPELVHAADGILVIRFVAGRTLAPADIRDAAMLERIASLLRRVHRDVAPHLRGPAACFWPFHVLRDYLAQLAEEGRLADRIPTLRLTVASLERAVGPIDLVLAHNDMMPGNLLDDGARLWLIDWEFAGFGSGLFDLAGVATNNDLDAAQRAHLLAAYLGKPPGRRAAKRFAAMALAASLRECLWGRIQETQGRVAFDYAGYAAENEAKFARAYDAYRKGTYL